MNELVDSRTRIWALICVIVGIGLYILLDLIEDPDSSPLDIVLNLLEITPLVLTCVGLVVLFQFSLRQRDEHLHVVRDLEMARIQGQRWRNDARSHLKGLGEAIEGQFNLWNLTESEREVALLLLKGLSSKEVAAVRATSERTVREQARSVYSKAGLSGRSALSAFFLEDLLAPIEGLGPAET